jgi:hypothetical protein
MSLTGMSVIAVLVLAHKVLPPRAAVDMPLAHCQDVRGAFEVNGAGSRRLLSNSR